MKMTDGGQMAPESRHAPAARRMPPEIQAVYAGQLDFGVSVPPGIRYTNLLSESLSTDWNTRG